MNTLVADRFDDIEARLTASPAIASYRVLRREVTPTDGKLRVKAALTDGGVAELFEYVTEASGRIQVSKYSFHWQDGQGKLIKRWDSAPHHTELNTPHHLHKSDESVEGNTRGMDMLQAITEIERGVS